MDRSSYDKAIKLLSLREHTEKELRAKLEDKGFSGEDIDSTIERLKTEGYLSEERFASAFIRSRLKRNPEGRPILLSRLSEKGSPRDIAVAALDEAWEEKMWKEPLRKELFAQEKRKGREWAIGKLRQKGFTTREIKEALEEEYE